MTTPPDPPDPPRPVRPLTALERARRDQYPPDPIPGILPGGGISLLAGASGVGKTALLAWWMTRIRDGLPLFGYPVTAIPQQALLAIDRSWIQSTSRWFELVDYTDFPVYSPPDDPSFVPSRLRKKHLRLTLLQEFLDQLGPLLPGALVYVDPLAPFLGGNLNDYDACAVACLEIREVCRQRHITLIGTAHTAKLKADPKDRYARVQDRILGSAALLGYTDTQMYLASPEETGTNYYDFFWNPHHAPPSHHALDRNPKNGLFVLAGDLPRHEDQQKILAFFREQPDLRARFVEVLAGCQLSKATTQRHLQALVVDGLLVLLSRGLYEYRPPN